MNDIKKTNPHKKHPSIKFLKPGTKICPVCGSRTQSINRITGYLSYAESDNKAIIESKGSVKNRFQKGKLDELKLRKKHFSCDCEK